MNPRKSRLLSLVLALVLMLSLASPALAAEDMVAINAANFPDATFRSYVAENFDRNGDNRLSVVERNAVFQIDVDGDPEHNGGITSLEGIAFFPALESLLCSYNQLTSLDVSKNTALTDLWCMDNQLTALDVSRNTALTRLGCSNNKLTSLDVSRNGALTGLWCVGNQLTRLDVGRNAHLTQLDCSNNQLTALEVTIS